MEMPRELPILTEDQWRAIAATAQRPIDAGAARREIEDCFGNYLGLRRPGANPAAWRDEWTNIQKLADELGNALDRLRCRGVKVEEEFLALKHLRQRADVLIKGYTVLTKVQVDHDPAREWLLWRLLTLWVDVFGGKLATSVNGKRGKPCGPLVRFLQATTAPVLGDDIPSPESIRYSVRKEAGRRRRAT